MDGLYDGTGELVLAGNGCPSSSVGGGQKLSFLDVFLGFHLFDESRVIY